MVPRKPLFRNMMQNQLCPGIRISAGAVLLSTSIRQTQVSNHGHQHHVRHVPSAVASHLRREARLDDAWSKMLSQIFGQMVLRRVIQLTPVRVLNPRTFADVHTSHFGSSYRCAQRLQLTHVQRSKSGKGAAKRNEFPNISSRHQAPFLLLNTCFEPMVV